MRGRRLALFATRADLLLLEGIADPDGRWKYVSQRYQWADERPRMEWGRLADVPGVVTNQRGGKGGAQWLFIAGQKVKVREERFKALGRDRWKLHESMYPKGAHLFTPGVYRRGRALLYGEMSTLPVNERTDAIIKAWRRAVRRACERKGMWCWGPETAAMARDGWRCAADVQCPRESDVRLG